MAFGHFIDRRNITLPEGCCNVSEGAPGNESRTSWATYVGVHLSVILFTPTASTQWITARVSKSGRHADARFRKIVHNLRKILAFERGYVKITVVSKDVKHLGMTIEQESLVERSSEARISMILTNTTHT